MKTKISFVCSECGAKSPRWIGKCPECNSWNTYTEKVEAKNKSSVSISQKSDSKIYKLADVSTEENYRIITGITELDRVLGGGIIPGSLVLAGGDPGIGKSTLMLQMCGGIKNFSPLYVTGEESLQQIKFRAGRIKGIDDNMLILAETNLEQIVYHIQASESRVVIIDSIQSIHSEKIEATPGSVVQIRECTAALMQVAKQSNKAIFIIGHVTKEGVIAGPKILEHMVDTVLQFEGEKTYSYRILRAIKNRFGSTNEIGIFDMSDAGLREVSNPSEIFLSTREVQEPGTSIVAAMEGSRPLILEVQALVTPTSYGVPQRTSNGYDSRRLQMVLAVLEKRLGAQFQKNDVFVNITGGVSLSDTSVDLGVAAALISSLRDEALDSLNVIIGEIGLTGEVRNVSNIERRLGECEKLGFKSVMLPQNSISKLSKKFDIKLLPTARISLALSTLFG